MTTDQIIQLINQTKCDFVPLEQQNHNIAAKVQDRIIQSDLANNPIDLYEILLIRKDHIIVKSLINGDKVVVPELTFDYPNVELEDNTTIALYRAKQVTAQAVAPINQPPQSAQPPQKQTKMAICKQLYEQHRGKSKKEICQLFQQIGQCTPLGANTYYLTIKKLYGD